MSLQRFWPPGDPLFTLEQVAAISSASMGAPGFLGIRRGHAWWTQAYEDVKALRLRCDAILADKRALQLRLNAVAEAFEGLDDLSSFTDEQQRALRAVFEASPGGPPSSGGGR